MRETETVKACSTSASRSSMIGTSAVAEESPAEMATHWPDWAT
ncbi:unannotated protein [freshwater metagenome]|uniref:Unannotated protein n=1 Tax=freshwater metagenome TaxID=449393 RepID=A0A6J6XPQ7_9ZZZZ